MKIEDIKPGDSLQGVEPSALVTVVAVVSISTDAVQLVYKTGDGTLRDRLVGRQDEDSIVQATRERPWSFDGDGDAFKLAVEAKRIDLAFLFDPMMAAGFQHIDETDQIGIYVGVGILDGVADSGLGRQIDHALRPVPGKSFI